MTAELDDVAVAGVLDGVSLTVDAGRITAIVGGDGSGKSTVLRVLAGGQRIDRGRVRRPPARRLGYVPSGSGSYPDLTVAENLAFLASVFGLGPAERDARADLLLARTGLDDARDRLARHLSGGERQKLALVLALLAEPDLVLLDEPTTGVDPVSRVELWRLVVGAAAGGAAIAVATAYLDEAERAGRVVVLDQGRVLLSGPPADLVAGLPGVVAVVAAPASPHSWRVGRSWRAWFPGPVPSGAEPIEPSLADAVIVAMLGAAA